MDLNDYRKQIDDIDRQLLALFGQRMEVAAAIAAYKKEHDLPVLDGKREREKLLDVAALSSRSCAELYGLTCLASNVQDQGNNFTRFICISKNLEIYPGADRTSLMMVLPHRPGSLYKVLSRFYALGINLNKLESRPMPERNFEFMFYFDLETSVYTPQFQQLMAELPSLCEEFSYLGSYSEVV